MKKLNALVLISMLMLFGCGKDDEPAPTPAVSDMATILTTVDRRTLVGRSVDISSARAQDVVGNYIFWMGEEHSAIPVVRTDKINGPVTEHVRKGDMVRITGTIRLLESVEAAHPMWDHVTEQEKADIMAATVYIDATLVDVI